MEYFSSVLQSQCMISFPSLFTSVVPTYRVGRSSCPACASLLKEKSCSTKSLILNRTDPIRRKILWVVGLPMLHSWTSNLVSVVASRKNRLSRESRCSLGNWSSRNHLNYQDNLCLEAFLKAVHRLCHQNCVFPTRPADVSMLALPLACYPATEFEGQLLYLHYYSRWEFRQRARAVWR